MKKKQVIGIIPARYASTRFPGKPLVEIKGKSMIQRVYEQASKTTLLDKVIVATDDIRIKDHVLSFGGDAAMTKTCHQSGTDRCAEITELYKEFDIVVNIQGDEPFIQPSQIDTLVDLLQNKDACSIATLAKAIEKKADFLNPNIVKVVFDKNNKALYFSRSPIPYSRKDADSFSLGMVYKHIGLYAFRREILLEVAKLPASQLEKTESLEQLRWLENGFAIAVGTTELETFGIDTPEDLEKV